MAILGPFYFSGGFSPGIGFTALPTEKMYATEMSGCRIKNGVIVPRAGTVLVNDASLGAAGNPVAGLTTWLDTANSVIAVVATCGTKLYTTNATSYYPAADGSTDLTFADRTGALSISATAAYSFDSLNNILVGAGNAASSGVPFKVTAYSSNGAALGGSPPSADIAKQVNNFMFLSRNLSSATTQSKVYWSNVNDPETWTAANVLEFNKNDGEPIMALGSIGTDLYIFKQTSIGRLGTTTITTSGAVTLGPLAMVIKGVGCCGPKAIDNLPNGNIVFVGFDGHFYEFDGSTIIDLSKEPWPGHNVYDSREDLGTSGAPTGIAFAGPTTGTCVKTWTGIGEVVIGYAASSPDPSIFHYDYINRIWQGYTINVFPRSFTTITSVASVTNSKNYESITFLLTGIANREIYSFGSQLEPFPNGLSSSGVTFKVGTTIKLAPQSSDFVPRSLCFETSMTNASSATLSSFILYADYDTYTASTSRYSATASTVLPTRIIVNLPILQDSVGTNIMPTYLSVLFAGVGTGSGSIEILRLGRFWLSDEVIR